MITTSSQIHRGCSLPGPPGQPGKPGSASSGARPQVQPPLKSWYSSASVNACDHDWSTTCSTSVWAREQATPRKRPTSLQNCSELSRLTLGKTELLVNLVFLQNHFLKLTNLQSWTLRITWWLFLGLSAHCLPSSFLRNRFGNDIDKMF